MFDAQLRLCSLEWRLAYRQGWQWCYGPGVYALLSIVAHWVVQGVEPSLWPQVGWVIVWILACLSVILSVQTFFAPDEEYAMSLLWCVRGAPRTFRLWLKYTIGCCYLILPLSFMSYLLSGLLAMPMLSSMTFLSALALAVSLILGLGLSVANLSSALGGQSNLLIMITLPLYVPVIFWGGGAIWHTQLGLSAQYEWYVLSGCQLIGWILFPWLMSMTVKIGVDP